MTCLLSIGVGGVFISTLIQFLNGMDIPQNIADTLQAMQTIIPIDTQSLIMVAGPLTFIVGIFQGLTAFGLFKKYKFA